RNDAAARVADREHHSVAEAIVMSCRSYRTTLAVAVALDDQPGTQQVLPVALGVAVAREQRVPARGRIAYAELRDRLGVETATHKILARVRRTAEALTEEERGALH